MVRDQNQKTSIKGQAIITTTESEDLVYYELQPILVAQTSSSAPSVAAEADEDTAPALRKAPTHFLIF